MAVTYKGVISGIGNKQDDVNIIYPEFDAQLRKFEVGKNAILSGFEYNEETGYLSAGYCLVEGYIGGNKENILIQKNNYVYGVFTVNHNKDISDRFEIEVHDSAIPTPQQDDILNSAGKYYFLIYPHVELVFVGDIYQNAIAQVKLDIIKFGIPITAIAVDENGLTINNVIALVNPSFDGRIDVVNNNFITVRDVYVLVTYTTWKYPSKAVYSDYTTTVEENGNLEDGVTCVTRAVDDNSNKVATDEFVHNVIDKKINYITATVDLSSNTSSVHYYLNFYHKSNYVIIKYSIQAVQNVSIASSFTIPNGFVPKTTQYTIINVKSFVSGDNFLYLLTLNANGTATLNQITAGGTITVPNYGELSAGYSLN